MMAETSEEPMTAPEQRRWPLSLFEGYGVELEYMIVDDQSLDVLPIADRVMASFTGHEGVSQVDKEEISWSNELAMHVFELKTSAPVPSLAGVAQRFQRDVTLVNGLLQPFGARLMPGGMHPWMDPFRELSIWPHEQNEVYHAFNRIFDCRGHGWANLQSNHLNLPFGDERQFVLLHSAIRLVLPLIPMLAASSPFADGIATGLCDTRLKVYRGNCYKLPAVTGHIIPETVRSFADYESRILQRMYRQIAPYDKEGVLQHEWLNARGAIARFDRGAIEIRLVDTQECPRADLAISAFLAALTQTLTQQRWASLAQLLAFEEDRLKKILLDAVKKGSAAKVYDRDYLNAIGWRRSLPVTAQELGLFLLEELHEQLAPEHREPLQLILRHGTLASRLLQAYRGGGSSPAALRTLYRQLCDCLADGRMFGV